MPTHRIRVIVPEDHRAMVEFPESVRSGPVDLLVLEAPFEEPGEEEARKGIGSLVALTDELAKDPRPFRELSLEERRARLEKIVGAGKGLMSSSEEFSQRKLEEVALEGRPLAQQGVVRALIEISNRSRTGSGGRQRSRDELYEG